MSWRERDRIGNDPDKFQVALLDKGRPRSVSPNADGCHGAAPYHRWVGCMHVDSMRRTWLGPWSGTATQSRRPASQCPTSGVVGQPVDAARRARHCLPAMREGETNKNGQNLVRKTKCLSGDYHPRPDHLPKVYIWEMQCGKCGTLYDVNNCDAWCRKCHCQGGRPSAMRL